MLIRCWTERVADGIEGVADKLRTYCKSRWSVISASVQGAAHRLGFHANQDAVATHVDGHGGKRVVVAVADGHGHASHFRSGVGSRLAVETAVEVVDSLLARSLSPAGFRELLEELPHTLHLQWHRRVAVDIAERPFDKEECSFLPPERWPDLAMNPALAYGTTLLVCVATDTFVAALQIGDGDILAVDDQGRVTRIIGCEEGATGEQTHSLCETGATRYFRSYFKLHGATPPACLMVSTDGYAKSYPHSDADFLRVGRDILNSLRQMGPDKVEHDLPHWLMSCSEEGSGDDITVALAYRHDALEKTDGSPR